MTARPEASPERRQLTELRARILELTAEYTRLDRDLRSQSPSDRIPFAGRVYDEAEVTNLVGASLDFWLTAGPWATRLERRLARQLGVRHCALVNSGSSANLLAFATLTSPRLGDRRVGPGDEVITVAAGFPTTVAPIVQLGAVPVFVDVTAESANIDVTQLEQALSPRTRAVMVAHTLGNPFDIDAVLAFCRAHDLWLVEDNCDGLGGAYTSRLDGRTGPTGSFGHLSTSSFYPAHHITTGEGGAVFTDDPELAVIVDSLRDWGRDCYCKSGRDNTCGQRFAQQFGLLPPGYDHKYVYSHFGFNLKMTDLQASVGLAQLDKLDGFVEARRRNHRFLSERLADLDEHLVLPRATPHSDPSWFGFLMLVRDGAATTRPELTAALEEAGIQTRSLFAGNLIRHPCFDHLRESGEGYRVAAPLTVTDEIAERAVWVGVYPGLAEPQLERMADVIRAEVARPARRLITVAR